MLMFYNNFHFSFPNKEMKRSTSGKMHYKFGFEKTIPSHRLMSRSTAKYASDERFGTYRCETRRAKSGRVYFVLDKQIHSRFRKHFSSKNRIDIRSKRDVVDGRCDIASGKVFVRIKIMSIIGWSTEKCLYFRHIHTYIKCQ